MLKYLINEEEQNHMFEKEGQFKIGNIQEIELSFLRLKKIQTLQ